MIQVFKGGHFFKMPWAEILTILHKMVGRRITIILVKPRVYRDGRIFKKRGDDRLWFKRPWWCLNKVKLLPLNNVTFIEWPSHYWWKRGEILLWVEGVSLWW